MALPFEAPIAPGLDRRPYADFQDYEYVQSQHWTDTITLLALSGIGIYGVRWGLHNIKIKVDPAKHLKYLSEGLKGAPGTTPFAQVAGLPESGLIEVPLRDLILEKLKWLEETVGGLPRTFGLVDVLAPGTITKPTSRLRVPAAHVKKAEDYFKALLGRDLTPEELKQGFMVAPYTEKQLLRDLPETGPGMLKAGTAIPGERPGLFVPTAEVDAAGVTREVPGKLVLPDVDIRLGTWAPKDVPEGTRQVFLGAQYRAAALGARFPVDTDFPFQITKATGAPKLTGMYRDLAKTFGLDIGRIEGLAAEHITPEMQRKLQTGADIAKSLATRYFKILDQPLEFLEELASRPDALGRFKETKGYKAFRNIFGTGGNYTGGVLDMTVRHGARIATVGLGLAAAYEVGSRLTDLAFGRDLTQVGGEAVAATERIYAAASDVTGLTAINQYQEREAEGSQRILGVLAFPLSGYLTGQLLASTTNRLAKKPEEFAWRAARQEVHRIPESLSVLHRLEKVPGFGDISEAMPRGRMFGKVGGAIGGLLSLPFLLGSFGSSRTYEEVVAEQQGQIETPVRKGAMWEMGRSDIEGGRIQYYDEGWYARLMNEGEGKLQYGEEEAHPITRMIKSIFDPYWREKEYYHDRPYPITGPDTSGFGPLGTLWGMTIGRVLKPPKFMHVEEASAGGYSGLEAGEAVQYGRAGSEAPAAPLGGLGPELTRTPYDAAFLGGELAYKATEAIGLPGFVFSSIKRELTGSSDFADEGPVLASFADVGSMRDRFWDLNIGGGYTSTEALRRFIPPERFQLQKVNPIANEMPSWMPGPSYYKDFRHGDPYGKIPRGERRLPGPGFAGRFPELEGVHPEDYPNIHRYKILADVAPYSREFRDVSRLVAQQNAEGELSDRDYELYKATQVQLEEKRKLREFRKEPQSASGSLIGGYWAALTGIGRANPVEHLLPFSPVHKFAGPTSAIQDYEETQVYSEENPYWGSPIEDFLAPAARMGGRALGFQWTPEHLSERRGIEEYFDKLEFMKFKRLQAEAEADGLSRVAFAYGRKAESTMYGTDPYGEVGQVSSALPRSERGYFEAFIDEEDLDRRAEILDMVPSYTRKFYTAQWNKQLYGRIMKEGPQSSEERKIIAQIERAEDFEGQPAPRGAVNDFLEEMKSGNLTETELPTYLRARRLEPYFDNAAPYQLPADDWVGWDPSTSLDDIKLKVVQNAGMDYHDFDMWEEQAASARRKPYLDAAADEVMYGGGGDTSGLRNLLTAHGLLDVEFDVMHNTGTDSRIMLEISRDRQRDIRRSFGE